VDAEALYGLAEKLGRRLLAKGQLLATAESCTGGLMAKTITDVPGSSTWFDRGFVSYSNKAKREMLGVNAQTLARFGAVSVQTAQEMVAGALRRSDADLAVAVTGIAGPYGDGGGNPVGTVFIAWQMKGGEIKVSRRQLSGGRLEIRAETVKIALLGCLEMAGRIA